jgi:hypothetical protein
MVFLFSAIKLRQNTKSESHSGFRVVFELDKIDDFLCKTEITELEASIFVEKDIGWSRGASLAMVWVVVYTLSHSR